MKPWFDANPELFRKEQIAVAEVQPRMILEKAAKGTKINQTSVLAQDCAICRGDFLLRDPDSKWQKHYSIVVIAQSTHPANMPILLCNDSQLPIGMLDRHIMTSGMACLGIGAEIKRKWRPENGLVGFFKDFVSPFLAWQNYYDLHGKAPPTGEREHGAAGIREFYIEELGLPDDSRVAKFMEFLAKPSRPNGHLACPCDSGKRLRDCHGRALWGKRDSLNWKHVQEDLFFLEKEKEEAQMVPQLNTPRQSAKRPLAKSG